MPVKKEDFSAIEEQKIQAIVSKAKVEILSDRKKDEDVKKWYAENGTKRFRCKITSTRKGEKTFELMCERPENPHKPKKIVGKLGVWLEDGLPMYVIQRLQEAYDSVAEETPENPNLDSGQIFQLTTIPRFNVIVGEEVVA